VLYTKKNIVSIEYRNASTKPKTMPQYMNKAYRQHWVVAN
jgi:hypothetical protein